jgi:hypothetical protein
MYTYAFPKQLKLWRMLLEASPNTRCGSSWLLARAHTPTTPVNMEPARRALMQALPAGVPDTYA